MIFSFATCALFLPNSVSLYNTCLCKLLISTLSPSAIPNFPTPAAARYCSTGTPKPPAPTTKTLDFANKFWASLPKFGKIICLEYLCIFLEFIRQKMVALER